VWALEKERAYDGGRQEQLAEMVARYEELLMKVCYAYLCDVQQAQDAVQETFLKAYKSLGGFRAEGSRRNWLITIARNTCRDMGRFGWFRHVDRRVRLEDLPVAGAEEVPEEEKELTAAVLSLPTKLKEAVVLYYYQNFSVKETAEILGITQPSVSNRLSRARKKLRAQLEKGD